MAARQSHHRLLAASVVGLFESTIAAYTALAVTMRGLALREITTRHTMVLVAKELRVGLINGLAIAAVTAAGVLVWSASWGIAMVMALAMVVSMVAARLAGVLVSITLRRLGQDPATSSSIFLATTTDVVGFFTFLGIATLLAAFL